jgi:hypothetical protein
MGAMQQAISRSRVWMAATLALSLLALAPSLPWLNFYHQTLDHRYEPGTHLRWLGETFVQDTARARVALEETTSRTGAVLALLVMLLGAFSAGGWLQVFLDRTESHSVRRFLHGGGRYFLRFARLWMLTLLALHVIGWLVYGAPFETMCLDWLLGAEGGELERLTSERAALAAVWLQDGAFALAFIGLMIWGDFARTRMAVLDSHSAVVAGWQALCGLVRHPLRHGWVWSQISLMEIVGVLAFTWLSRWVESRVAAGGGMVPLLVLSLLGVACIAWRTIARGARYAAAVYVTRELLGRGPEAERDSLQNTIGGPGGPRYPIGGDDEYSVSV